MPSTTKQAPLARGVPFLGSIPELAIRGFVPMLSDFWRDNGDFFRMRMGPRNVFAFTHPDAMKRVFKDRRENYVKGEAYDGFRLIVGDGMITMEGDAWAHRRRAAARSGSPGHRRRPAHARRRAGPGSRHRHPHSHKRIDRNRSGRGRRKLPWDAA